jgi:hypothetical protein
MATKKKSSSGSGSKSRKKVQSKMQKVMHEYKHGELKSGGKKKVKNPKQAIAIGLSEARRSGANVPKKGASKKKSSSKKSASSKKTAAKKGSSHKSSKK